MNRFYIFVLLFLGTGAVYGTTIFSENIGTPAATTLITAYSGWQNNGILSFDGTGDVRTTTPSTYTGASGAGNVFLTNNAAAKTYLIAGFSTTGYASITLSFGVYKNSTTSNGSELSVEYSTSGIAGPWNIITIPALPTGTGTAIWYYVTSTGVIPSGANAIRFTNTNATSPQFRIDDITLTGTPSTSTSEIQLQQPVGSDATCGFSYSYGTQNIGINSDFTVRVKNLGTGPLTISSTTLSGANAAEFSVVTPPTSPIAAGSFSDMIVRFSPVTPGAKYAMVTINSDDADESNCTINLNGIANFPSCSELIISEYGEPVVASGKYLELYNSSSSPVNLSDYALWRVSNGGSLWSGATTLSLTGTLAPKQTYVIANNPTDVPGANLYNAGFCNWNGDDAVGLAKNISGTFYLTDAVGTDSIGYAGTGGWAVAGTSNATSDRILIRKTSVTTPNTDWNTSAGSTVVNSEWYVRPYQITNIGCHINTCSGVSTVGFTTTTTAVPESNTVVTVNVSMDIAPTSIVNITVSNSSLGTATSSLDYVTFASATLTFSPAEVYPNTKSISINILDDALSETNELIALDLDAQCDALVSNSRHTITIIDNEVPEGIVINEISQGSGNKEYVELVVTGTPGTTVDLRGWIIDDNSGIFSAGYGTLLGIAPGHIKFSDICTWEKVPAGSIILIYNATDKNANITLPDDPTDGDLDYTYVIGIEAAASSCATMATSNMYFSADCIKPNNASYDQYIPPVYTNVDWNAMQLRNGGDAVQLRSPSGGFFHGLSYGSKGTGSDCATCAINQINHPDYSIYGTDALYFSGTSIITMSNQNTIDIDYRKLSNWAKTTAASPNILETPGTFNSAANQAWILSLRKPFGVVTDDKSYTCDLRAFESRYYLDGIDSIIYWIKNNISTNHGPLTAQTIIHNTAPTGKGFQNVSLTGTPLFLQKTFAATPTNYTPANYKIRFYVSTQELQEYCDYINPILNAIPGYYTGHNHTPAEVVNHLKIYRTSTTDRAWTVTNDAQVQIVTPTIGSYTSMNGTIYTTFEYNGFTGFSGYALGDVVTPIIGLPVELVYFNAKCMNDVMHLNWTTASEINSNYFEVERSSDAIHFTPLTQIRAANKSNEIRHYEFTDSYPASGVNYYRLKQVDFGNTAASYSNIIQASCLVSDQPVHVNYQSEQGIVVTMNMDMDKSIQFNLYEMSGKLLYNEQKLVAEGNSIFVLNFHEKLAAGIYLFQTINGSETTTQKLWIY